MVPSAEAPAPALVLVLDVLKRDKGLDESSGNRINSIRGKIVKGTIPSAVSCEYLAPMGHLPRFGSKRKPEPGGS